MHACGCLTCGHVCVLLRVALSGCLSDPAVAAALAGVQLGTACDPYMAQQIFQGVPGSTTLCSLRLCFVTDGITALPPHRTRYTQCHMSQVTAFSLWTREAAKLASEPRFKGVTSAARRKELFDEYCKWVALVRLSF